MKIYVLNWFCSLSGKRLQLQAAPVTAYLSKLVQFQLNAIAVVARYWPWF